MRPISAILLGILLLLIFGFAIFLLIPFPLVVFQQLVNSNVFLQRKSDGQFTTGTYFWSKLPSVQYYSFYLFNVTNPDEVLYNGATPNMLELGPYTYAETEFKDSIEFRNNDNEIFYQNNKTWIYNQERSCKYCTFDDIVTIANPSYMTNVFMALQNPDQPPLINFGLDVLTLLLGENPLRSVSGSGVLFVGYDDPLILLLNSQFTKVLMNYLGNPIALPQVVAGGIFPHYNHTCDGNYTLKSGKDNPENTALIQTWNDSPILPWWKTKETRDLRNSGDGAFQKPNLQKTDKLKQFQSFVCRAFNMSYSGKEKTVRKIPTISFQLDPESYDAVKNEGYRYDNIEKVNYFPNWPCGPNFTHVDNGNCGNIDCSISENFCKPCCHGSFINGTYLLPPGITPQACLPGKNVLAPFGIFLSAPHFLGSPREVIDSMIGIHPDEEKHSLGEFMINPETGSTISGTFRMQTTIPIFQSSGWTVLNQVPNAPVPIFWLDLNIELKDYAVNYIYFNVITVPMIVLGVGIALLLISLLAAFIWAFLFFRKRRRLSAVGIKIQNNNRIGLDLSWGVTD